MPHGQLVKHAGTIDPPSFVVFVLRTGMLCEQLRMRLLQGRQNRESAGMALPSALKRHHRHQANVEATGLDG